MASSPYNETKALALSTSAWCSATKFSSKGAAMASKRAPSGKPFASISSSAWRFCLPLRRQKVSTTVTGTPRDKRAAARKPGSPPMSKTPEPARSAEMPQLCTIQSAMVSASTRFLLHHVFPQGVCTHSAHWLLVHPSNRGSSSLKDGQGDHFPFPWPFPPRCGCGASGAWCEVGAVGATTAALWICGSSGRAETSNLVAGPTRVESGALRGDGV